MVQCKIRGRATMVVAQMPGWVRYILGFLTSFFSEEEEMDRKLSVHGFVDGREAVRTRMSVRRLEDS